MKSKNWNIAKPDGDAIRRLSGEGGYPLLTAAVLCARGITTMEGARAFLSTSLSGLQDPWLLPDMAKAVAALSAALEAGERIAVFGDYDVDGITSTCVLVRYLRSRGADCLYYIPDRLTEGYGLNKSALQQLKDSGVSLVVTVDTGITALEEIAFANDIGLRVVVTDHHECKDEMPPALAVVNPKRLNSAYPFSELAGVGVAFKLICALAGEENQRSVIESYIDLVAVGTIADVMPLVGENRIIVAWGLQRLQRTQNPGLRMLIREAGVEERRMTSSLVSFTLAPRINAAGRMGCADKAVQLFLTEDEALAQELSALLCCQNRQRQNEENQILQQAYETLKTEYHPETDRIIVLWGENWHHGVVGIVSSRISDRYGCPTVLISMEGDVGKGSGRSVRGFNLFDALEHSSRYLERFGGHALAAGLTIQREHLEDFKACITEYARENLNEEDAIPVVDIDCMIRPDHITFEAIRDLGMLEPYGMGNPEPVFCIREMRVEEITPISSDRHLKMTLSKDGLSFTALLFGTGSGGCPVVTGNAVDAAFSLSINTFRGHQTIQLMLRDIRLSASELYQDKCLLECYSAFINNGALTRPQIARLYPERPDLVAVWRHLISRSRREQGKLTAPYNTLSRRIEYESRRDINIGKLFVCLDVFAESRLLDYHFKNDMLHIELLPFQGKADITKSVVLATLRQIKKQDADIPSGRSE